MKQSHFMALKTVLGVAMIALVVTVAHAWTAPTGTAPSGNVPVPVNTGATAQTKTGDFSSLGNISALGSVSASKYVAALQFLFSPMAVLGCTNGLACILNASNTLGQDVLRAGGFNTSGYLTQGARINKDGNIALGKITTGQAFPSRGLFIGNILGQDFTTAFGKLGVSLSGSTGSAGRNALEVSVSNDNLTGTAGAVLQTNADKFSFFNTAGTDRVGLSAKKIQLTEGAAQGKVLTSDASGNGSWMDSAATNLGNLQVVRKTGPAQGVEAYCGAGTTLVAGGGHCYGSTSNSARPQINAGTIRYPMSSSEPGPGQTNDGSYGIGQFNYWHVDCHPDASGATAYAICAPIAGYTPPAAPANWHIASGQGTVGQTCAAWIANDPNYEANPLNTRGYGTITVSGLPLSGTSYSPSNASGQYSTYSASSIATNCAYQYTSDETLAGAPGGGLGITSFTSKCHLMPSSFSAPNAKPVGSCTDSGSVNSSLLGNNTPATYDLHTELYY